MRKLSANFMQALKNGFLSGITQTVIEDKSLDLHIRDNYLNVYYKGNSLVKLTAATPERYKVDIHPKFLGDMQVPDLVDQETTDTFLHKIPGLKANITRYGKASLEIEYEQLIIRANNCEARNNSDYFIVDRQYTLGRDRIDLLGFFWDRNKRRRGQTVAPCLMEVKFALNADIGRVHQQLARYYEAVKADAVTIAEDAESSLRQRLELGLYDQAHGRLEAMKTLILARDIEQFQFILILVDYNPHSRQLDLAHLASLPFANQVKLFFGGFAMWEHRLESIGK
jgi:hypothetical protein